MKEPTDPYEDMVRKALDLISEHFDSVVIIATGPAGGDTDRFCLGSGNAYAQRGSLREQLLVWDEETREEVRNGYMVQSDA